MDLRKFSAIQFLTSAKEQHRVYYQTTDNYIRESSYNDENRWFTSGNGIVTRDAKADSPIAVTCWCEKDGETQIRVYYLDYYNNIRECKGVYQSSGTTWETGVVLKQNLKVAPVSQLTVARPDKDATTLRVYFQETGDKKYIRELKYIAKTDKWGLQGSQMQGALEGSRLSAVSDRRTAGIVRLYYQGTDLRLCEGYWNDNGLAQQKAVQDTFQLVNKAAISAISWYTDSELHLRVFTVLASSNAQISQISYEDGDWDENPATIIAIAAGSEISASRLLNDDADANDPIFVFNQPYRGVIDLKAVATGTGQAAVAAVQGVVLLPWGIPTYRSG